MAEENIGTEAENVERKIYEIGYHIVPSVPEDKLALEVDILKDVIEKSGSTVISEETPKMHALAYEMRKEIAGKYAKYRQAYFGWIKFEASSLAALSIESAFKKNSSVLRYLLIKTVKENTMTVPKIPSYRKAPTSGEIPKVGDKKEEKVAEKTQISDVELDKALDAAIAE